MQFNCKPLEVRFEILGRINELICIIEIYYNIGTGVKTKCHCKSKFCMVNPKPGNWLSNNRPQKRQQQTPGLVHIL